MSTPYVPEKYTTLDDALDHLGFTKVQINALDDITRNRYQNWVREGNNLVESTLFSVGNSNPLTKNTPEFTYAVSAVLSWVVYKKRDKEGSKNAINAREDHDRDIEKLKEYLVATRTERTVTASILGKSLKNQEILLPSQIDTQFY